MIHLLILRLLITTSISVDQTCQQNHFILLNNTFFFCSFLLQGAIKATWHEVRNARNTYAAINSPKIQQFLIP